MRGNRPPFLVVVIIVTLVALPVRAVEDSADGPALPEDLPTGWYARIQTSAGTILVRLLPEQAPQSVAHFVAFAEGKLEWTDALTGETHKDRLYDGIQVIYAEAGARFEIGSPNGTVSGGPTAWIPRDEGHAPFNFNSGGRIGMSQGPGQPISGYRFFVTAGAQPLLSGRLPCFGTVVSGQEVVLEITAVKTHPNGRPIEPVTIQAVRILRQGNPPPLAEPRSHRPTRAEPVLEEAPSAN